MERPPSSSRASMARRAHLARAGTRVIVALCLGVAGYAAAAAFAPWQVAVLAGWDTAAATVVAWVLLIVLGRDAAETAGLATREDDSRAGADLVLVSAAVASLAGVGLSLLKASDAQGAEKAAITAVTVLTVVLSWAAVHAVFTLRYARIYYTEGGGIDFNEDPDPDYRDFAYLALTLGMTYQVSDTDLTTKSMRRTATRHALLSYVFGTVVLAMTINVLVNLVK